MSTKYNYSARDIREAAEGEWRSIISQVSGIAAEHLDGKGHPCPKCGGENRFVAFKSFDKRGGVHCRHCHNKTSKPKPGDGIAAVQWLKDCTFPEALQSIADCLGLAPRGDDSQGRLGGSL